MACQSLPSAVCRIDASAREIPDFGRSCSCTKSHAAINTPTKDMTVNIKVCNSFFLAVNRPTAT